jgi:hypothetical protein
MSILYRNLDFLEKQVPKENLEEMAWKEWMVCRANPAMFSSSRPTQEARVLIHHCRA